jgi:hypothetical protein
MISPVAVAAMQQIQLGELWLEGNCTSYQAPSSARVV